METFVKKINDIILQKTATVAPSSTELPLENFDQRIKTLEENNKILKEMLKNFQESSEKPLKKKKMSHFKDKVDHFFEVLAATGLNISEWSFGQIPNTKKLQFIENFIMNNDGICHLATILDKERKGLKKCRQD